MIPIHFFYEDITFTLKKKSAVKKWVKNAIIGENQSLKELNFIFCSDEYLLSVNKTYLNHDTYTDIITFDNSDEETILMGDIFISVERIHENAQKFNVTETDELHRVMIHGVLHLLGYKDKSKSAKLVMTAKENEYLKTRDFV